MNTRLARGVRRAWSPLWVSGAGRLPNEAEVSAASGAGITSLVTPGWANGAPGWSSPGTSGDAPDTTNGRWTVTNGNDSGAGSAAVVFDRGPPNNWASGLGYVAGGLGTEASPYIINHLDFYNANATDTQPVLTINASSSAAWFKFVNCRFSQGSDGAANIDMISINLAATGGVVFENCSVYNNSAGGANVTNAVINLVQGNVLIDRCLVPQNNNWRWLRKTGASGYITVIDSLFDTSLGGFGSNGNGDGIFVNTTAGGSLTIRRTTINTLSAIPVVHSAANWAVTADRISWNPSASVFCQAFIPTSTGYVPTAWTSGLTVTDCHLTAGTTNATVIGFASPNSNQTVNNVTIQHCDFDEAVGRTGLQSKINLGKGDAGASGTCDNILIEWTRFDGEGTSVIAGNEQCQLFQASNATMRYCWADSGGEDAFEIEGPWANCHVHHCGGAGVNGNLVDFFGLNGVWTNSTNCSIHDIWGDCGGDAVVVDSCSNVEVSNIDAANVNGGFAQNSPCANVRLHSRGANSLNGVVVREPLTLPAECFGAAILARPCLLTCEEEVMAPARTGTGTSGAFTLTLNNATGFLAGDLIAVELDTTSAGGTRLKHYSTQVGAPAGLVITIADALPANVTARRVMRVVDYSPGSPAWPRWTGAAYSAATGVEMVVNSQV